MQTETTTSASLEKLLAETQEYWALRANLLNFDLTTVPPALRERAHQQLADLEAKAPALGGTCNDGSRPCLPP